MTDNRLHKDAPARIGFEMLPAIPQLMTEYRRALGGMLPGVWKPGKLATPHTAPGSRDRVPCTGFEVTGVVPELNHLAEYCLATGLRLGQWLPATYPYVLGFPLAIKLMNAPGFLFAAVGTVHLTNSIEQFAPIPVGTPLDFRVFAGNPRAHRAGVLIDVITEVCAGTGSEKPGAAAPGRPQAVDSGTTTPSDAGRLLWRQVSGFLGKGAATDGLPAVGPSAIDHARIPEAQPAFFNVDQRTIASYANASGDKNPIHVSKLGAKAFGFPTTIAHGMWQAAFMLSRMEGLVPRKLHFDVEFGKLVRIPGRVAFTAERD
ncbi:MaoC/PaaZ C-terminal domain-containing protein [Corynebacterium atypicum]|uniref:MaoC/PaaZ C-terminal domain-containing protein n=1 Tax=Corynebacterium atypicum TaxID=191610 RepID=UPI000A0627F8|nr:MaoC/PaaZ C-terminal domain-containing protein [Corynebacterium atypicum]